MDNLTGRHALITGGNRGIGAAIAGALAAAGATVSIVGRDEASLKAQVDLGRARAWRVADVTDQGSFAAAAQALAQTSGPIDILVNNAGGAFSAPFAKTSADDFRRMMDLNFMGVVHGVQAVLPGMVARRSGRIVNIASTAALKGYAYVSAYVAAKHAVLGLTRSLALETARSGVTVNCVCPGFTDTDLIADSVELIIQKTGRVATEVRAELARANPQGRLIQPDEVAAAVTWLCGPGAGSVTGVALPVAGGEI
ncbi:SDR family NAD(P)-dependent oxidoreductase [Phenylobacterium sp.]|uniref:SDR family NAD(P)-dependent oxidoreductase n=1 Tax=Phenylobacterium sp. TaxID=1871053 RepID=UPI0027357222|nr:SDR family NAD(P)-dependent oxidoreductase [Phenylobacterium sp.]MDP3853663.1 SDR family NAD(P)-dependent oxidoreductase [Phenylobacterium sp.]